MVEAGVRDETSSGIIDLPDLWEPLLRFPSFSQYWHPLVPFNRLERVKGIESLFLESLNHKMHWLGLGFNRSGFTAVSL